MKQMIWSLAPLVLTIGCASEDTADGTEQSVASELARAEAEVQRHHDVVVNASDARQVVAETTTHRARMRGILDQMGDAMSEAMHCSGPGKHQLHSTLATLKHAEGEHMGQVQGERSLEALQAACAVYVEDLHALLVEMHDSLAVAACMR